MSTRDTIAAIASAAGHSGVGVIRVSGEQAKSIAKKLCRKELPTRQAILSSFYSEDDQALDSGLALFFAKPKSYTGEDVLEIHTHGNPHVMAFILDAIVKYGARHAKAGEFTERAFLNGKIDLLQAEAVADLINANSQAAATAALSSLQGVFSEQVNALNANLVEARAMIEGALDFPDEDFDPLEHFPVKEKIHALKEAITLLLSSAKQGHQLRHGKKVVIFGKPNVGKSSLMNFFSQDEVAIVTDVAGTTRDSLSKQISLDELNIELVDTAGLRETDDVVEQEGIARTQQQIEQADILLLLVDTNDDVKKELEKIAGFDKTKLVLINKIDLVDSVVKQESINETICLSVSVKQQLGLDKVLTTLKSLIVDNNDNETPFMARQAHLNAFGTALLQINNAKKSIEHKQLELAAESLKYAQDELEGVIGKTTADDVLTEIFSQFCIGK